MFGCATKRPRVKRHAPPQWQHEAQQEENSMDLEAGAASNRPGSGEIPHLSTRMPTPHPRAHIASPLQCRRDPLRARVHVCKQAAKRSRRGARERKRSSVPAFGVFEAQCMHASTSAWVWVFESDVSAFMFSRTFTLCPLRVSFCVWANGSLCSACRVRKYNERK